MKPYGMGIMVLHETVARVRRNLKKRARRAERAAVEESAEGEILYWDWDMASERDDLEEMAARGHPLDYLFDAFNWPAGGIPAEGLTY